MHHIFRRAEIYQDYAMSSQLSSLLLMIGISQKANPNGLSENNVKALYGLNYAKSKHPKITIFNLLAYKTQKNLHPLGPKNKFTPRFLATSEANFNLKIPLKEFISLSLWPRERTYLLPFVEVLAITYEFGT